MSTMTSRSAAVFRDPAPQSIIPDASANAEDVLKQFRVIFRSITVASGSAASATPRAASAAPISIAMATSTF